MKIIDRITERYFKWLCDKLFYGRDISHKKLIRKLFELDFIYIIRNDENRESDGLYLRKDFKNEANISKDYIFDFPCSVLEMLLTLCQKIDYDCSDSITGPLIDVAFYMLIDNAGLLQFDDYNYDDSKIEDIIENILYHNYLPNGEGSFFPLKRPMEDSRDLELLTQMNRYLNEIDYILPKSYNYLIEGR